MEVLTPGEYKRNKPTAIKEVDIKPANTKYGADTVAGAHAAKVAEERAAIVAEFTALLNAEADTKAVAKQQAEVTAKEEAWHALERGLAGLQKRAAEVKAEQGRAVTAEDIVRLRREAEELSVSIPATRYEMFLAEYELLRAQAPLVTRNQTGIKSLQRRLDEEAALLSRRRLALRQMFSALENEEQHRRDLLQTAERRLTEAREALSHEATRGGGLKKPGLGAPPAGVPYK